MCHIFKCAACCHQFILSGNINETGFLMALVASDTILLDGIDHRRRGSVAQHHLSTYPPQQQCYLSSLWTDHITQQFID